MCSTLGVANTYMRWCQVTITYRVVSQQNERLFVLVINSRNIESCEASSVKKSLVLRFAYLFVEGEHTLVKTVVTAKVGGLARFAKKVATCLGCKAVLRKGRGTSFT